MEALYYSTAENHLKIQTRDKVTAEVLVKEILQGMLRKAQR